MQQALPQRARSPPVAVVAQLVLVAAVAQLLEAANSELVAALAAASFRQQAQLLVVGGMLALAVAYRRLAVACTLMLPVVECMPVVGCMPAQCMQVLLAAVLHMALVRYMALVRHMELVLCMQLARGRQHGRTVPHRQHSVVHPWRPAMDYAHGTQQEVGEKDRLVAAAPLQLGQLWVVE